MSEFVYTCPHCAGRFYAQEEWIGESTECPNCKQSICIEKQSCSVNIKQTEERSYKNILVIGMMFLVVMGCGSPRKLDNLNRCKMACKLKQKGPFYEEVLRQQIQEPCSA